MPPKMIYNAKPPDGNLVRGTRTQTPPVPLSLIPEGFCTTPDELEVLKWALQFYLYQEKNQKLSGKIFLNEITDEKKATATNLLQRLG